MALRRDVTGPVDTALREFVSLQHVVHPLAFETFNRAVHTLLTDLGLTKAADRWAGVSVSSPMAVPAKPTASSD